MLLLRKSKKECYAKGITGLQKADRRSKVWRDKLSQHAKRQMQEGRSIFSPDDVRDPNIPMAKFSGIGTYAERAKELGYDLIDIDSLISADRDLYLKRGAPVTELCGSDQYFKLGVSNDLSYRQETLYHGFLYTADRVTIANLEYEVKMEFKDKIILGNEGFDINFKSLILEFIENKISQLKSQFKVLVQ